MAHKSQRKTPYGCNTCFKLFESPSKLSRHYLIHTGQKPYRCHLCPKTFTQLVHRERHQQTHCLPFQCGICHRSYKNKATFQKHQQTHSGTFLCKLKLPKKSGSVIQEQPAGKPFICIFCEKTFSTEARWVLHKCILSLSPRAHRSPILGHQKCDFCLKPFPSRSKLERHILIHTGQRPFSCHQCDKSFRQKTHLKIHQISHMQDKPFKCGLCQRSFKVQSNLVKHRQVHARKAQKQKVVLNAREIGVTLTSPPILEDVIFKPLCEDPDEICSVYVIPFQCPVCEQNFETQQILESHTCFIDEFGKVLNNGRRTLVHKPIGRSGKLLTRVKEVENRHSEMKLFPRRQRNSNLADQKPVHVQEPSAINPCVMDTKLTAVKKLITHKMVHAKQIIHKTKAVNMVKFVQNKKLNITLPCENLLNDDISGDMEDVICVSSSTECNTSELSENFLRSPQQRRRRLKIVNKCDACQKTFQSLSKLRRHYLVHTGQKPFSCATCGKKFRQAVHLKKHQVIHAKIGLHQKTIYSQVEFQNSNFPLSYQLDSMELRFSSPESSSLRPLADFDYDMSHSEPIAEIQVVVEADTSV